MNSKRDLSLAFLKKELERAQRVYGLFSKVARDLGLSPNHVRQVALGRRTSSRVQDALAAEYARLLQEERAA